jgi:hypothetical protein
MRFDYDALAKWASEMESGKFGDARETAYSAHRRYCRGLHDECAPVHNSSHRKIWESLLTVSSDAQENYR